MLAEPTTGWQEDFNSVKAGAKLRFVRWFDISEDGASSSRLFLVLGCLTEANANNQRQKIKKKDGEKMDSKVLD